jgi:hypothetical protein
VSAAATASATLRERLGPERLHALRTVLGLFALFQLTVWTVASVATLKLLSHRPLSDPNGLTQPLDPLGSALIAPLARYDAAWYLGIASHGYGPAHEGLTKFMGFFPLYPLIVRAVALAGGGGRVALVLAGSLVASVCLVGALYLLHRLVELDLGPRFARPTLVLLLVFPTAFFFAAPYSESLFLLLSVGAIYAARTGRWAWAGLAAGLASATRLSGLLLLIPLAILYLWPPPSPDAARAPARAQGRLRALLPRRAPRWNVLWLGLAPLGAAAFFAYLGLRYGHPRAYFEIQQRYWYHHTIDPLAAVTRPFAGAYHALRALHDGASFGLNTRARIDAVTRLAFVLLGFASIVGIARRVQPAYAAYAAASMALPLISPPATGLPRYLLVVFPLFMWLALLTERRGLTEHVARVSAALLGLLTAAFATWHFVS